MGASHKATALSYSPVTSAARISTCEIGVDIPNLRVYDCYMSNHIESKSLPFVVCPTCAGHGTHGPGHVFTQEDLDEQFGHDADEVMADYRAGVYDVRCEGCNGQRVVLGECPCASCEQDRIDDFNDRAAAAFEARYC